MRCFSTSGVRPDAAVVVATTSGVSAVLLPDVNVGRGARLTKVVVDRGVRIPDGMVVGEDPEEDARRFRVSEKGVCLITQAMLDRLA